MLADHLSDSSGQEVFDQACDALRPVMVKIAARNIENDFLQVATAAKAAALVLFMFDKSLEHNRFARREPQHGRGHAATSGLRLFKSLRIGLT